MPINVNFVFPEGCTEKFTEAEMPVVPRIGEHIQGSHPHSGRYQVTDVRYDIDSDTDCIPRCIAITVILKALDQINFERH